LPRRLSALDAVIATITATHYIDLAYCRDSGIKVFVSSSCILAW